MRYFSSMLPLLTIITLWGGILFPTAALSQQGIPFTLPPKSELSKIRSAVLTTEKGQIVFELYPEIAPWHVANFKYLADQNFYNGTRFHIFRPGKIIQGGSPRTDDPDAGPGYSLPPEFSNLRHSRGTLGMARKPDILNRERNSHGSQFHILLTDASKMDGSFTVFGKIVKGMDVADSLRKGDIIKDLVVYVRPDKKSRK